MKLIIPTSLKDITWSNFQKYKKVMASEDITEDIRDLALVTIFCDLTLQESKLISQKDIKEIADQILRVLDFKPTFQQTFEHKGVKYGFIPNLDEMSAGEYIDLEKYLKDDETHTRALAVMYRPIKSRFKDLYNIEEYQGTEATYRDFEDVNLDVALGATVFFYTLSRELLRALVIYLRNLRNQEVSTGSLTNGDGINQSIRSLVEISESLTRLLNLGSTNF